MRWAPKLTHGVIGLLQFVRFLKNLRINFLDCDCQMIFECAIIKRRIFRGGAKTNKYGMHALLLHRKISQTIGVRAGGGGGGGAPYNSGIAIFSGDRFPFFGHRQ